MIRFEGMTTFMVFAIDQALMFNFYSVYFKYFPSFICSYTDTPRSSHLFQETTKQQFKGKCVVVQRISETKQTQRRIQKRQHLLICLCSCVHHIVFFYLLFPIPDTLFQYSACSWAWGWLQRLISSPEDMKKKKRKKKTRWTMYVSVADGGNGCMGHKLFLLNFLC